MQARLDKKNTVILNEPIFESLFLSDLLRSTALSGENVVAIGIGSSTPLLIRFCDELALNLYTVVESQQEVMRVKQLLRDRKNVFSTCQKGEEFLRRFDEPIVFAYLDNNNWVHPLVPNPDKDSSLWSNRENELVHLEQTIELVKSLRSGGLVLFGDTWFLEGRPPGSGSLKVKVDFQKIPNEEILERYEVFGKGSLAVPFLVCSGFEVMAVSEKPRPQILLKKAQQPVKSPPYAPGYFSDLLVEHRLVKYGYKSPLGAWFSRAWSEDVRPNIRRMRALLRLRTRVARLVNFLSSGRQA